MSDPDGPVPAPEQPEPVQPAVSEQPGPAQPGPAQPQPAAAQPAVAAQPEPAQPAVAPPPAAPAQAAYPVPPARQRGTGFTVLVSALTALVVAVVVAAGTAFAVTRSVDRNPHRVTVSELERCPSGPQRSDQSGRWDQQRGPDADDQVRRGLPDGSSPKDQGSTDSSEQEESPQGS